MDIIFFYNKLDGKIFSYIQYDLQYSGEILLNKPSVEQCAINNDVSAINIGIAKFLVINPTSTDFKDDKDDLDVDDYEIL